MRRTIWGAIGLPLLFFNGPSCVSAFDRQTESDIRAIFAESCLQCHGPVEQESRLRVDRRSDLLRGGDSGLQAVVPGNPRKSYLIELLRSPDDNVRMPLGEERLSAAKIQLIEQWIADGASWPGDTDAGDSELATDHWSLQPVVKPDVPSRFTEGFEVDAFVQDKLRDAGLDFHTAADPRTLIRRVSIVLTGLPPLPTEIDGFLAASQRDPDAAYEQLVDRLLDSPHFGERWAQHWLDVIRWAESSGSESNYYRKNAWWYRDYLIDAFNADKPYSDFLKDQIAGDTRKQDAATGFLVSGPYVPAVTVGRQEEAIKRARFDRLNEVVQTVGTAVMAMTVGCARCHNHKFDPISIRDYYSMVAVFQDIDFDHRVPLLPEEHPRVRAGRQIMSEIASLRDQVAQFGSWDEQWADHRKMHFTPRVAEKVRVTFLAESIQLDEVEIHSTRDSSCNRATGAIVTTSRTAEDPVVPPAYLVDSRYTAFWGWQSQPGESPGNPWINFQLAKPVTVARVDISSHRFDHYATDYIEGLNAKIPSQPYRIELFHEDKWVEVASSASAEQLNAKDKAMYLGLIGKIEALARKYDQEGPQPIFAGRLRTPVSTHVLHRGDPLSPREEVTPSAPKVIKGALDLADHSSGPQRRAAFASWLADTANPLPARVMVNRLWHHVLGTGIVSTPGDFGRAGALPSHPELLDWLAATYIEDGWSTKRMLRRLVMSRTFRQASTPRGRAITVDAGNRLLWRFQPRRVEAEVLRDSILAAAGKLNRTIGGPSYRIHNVKNRYQQWTVVDNHGPTTWRRMIYQERMRGIDDGMFSAFDFPDCSQIRAKRPVSTTPLQALNLLNGRLVAEQAKNIAEEVAADASQPSSQIDAMFRRILGRLPEPSERGPCLAVVATDGLASLARILFNTNEFAFLN